VKASLNHACSRIPEIYWISSGDTSNVAEACHSDANREGKHLKFLTAIFRYVLSSYFDIFFYFILTISQLNYYLEGSAFR